MKESELRTRAKALALHMIVVCDEVDTRKGRSVLVNQVIRSVTSIGANIHEANYASSKADFINKFHIALKECAETLYWLELLWSCDYFTDDEYQSMHRDCEELRKILSSITMSTREE